MASNHGLARERRTRRGIRDGRSLRLDAERLLHVARAVL